MSTQLKCLERTLIPCSSLKNNLTSNSLMKGERSMEIMQLILMQIITLAHIASSILALIQWEEGQKQVE